MSLLLYINNQLADLEAGQPIARTLQVNDLNSLNNRQASYTNKFKLPKTANNVRIMQFLTLPGSTSVIPYEKNICSLYSETGECFVYNGRAVITDGGDSYDVVIYDGIIDLYKAIENKTLAEVVGESLNHEKDSSSVTASWYNPDSPYCYIVADYNGKKAPLFENKINIDYLVPSVNVKWLWDRIFSHHNFTSEGAVFNTHSFKNLWMTFPKGVMSSNQETLVYDGRTINVSHSGGNHVYFVFSPNEEEGVNLTNGIHFTFPESGHYRIEISGNIHLGFNQQVRRLYFTKNSLGTLASAAGTYHTVVNSMRSTPFTIDHKFSASFNRDESISLVMNTRNYHQIDLFVKIYKLEKSEFNFTEAFSDFSINDFLNEVVHRFGLTIFPDSFTKKYRFLTLQERLQTTNIIDWSDKYISTVSENYIYGSYAQRNWMRYNYNDKDAGYYDGSIDVANVNLPDTRDIIKSKMYCPEIIRGAMLGRLSNIYKLWEKEMVENPGEGEETVKYKPLDKRYYFMQRQRIDEYVNIFSPQLGQSQNNSNYYIESFYKMGLADVIDDYYKPLEQLLDKSLIVTAELFLKETDVANFNFSALYYIKQLSNYFLVNKINNYIPGKPVKCELIRVKPGTIEKEIIITDYQRLGTTLTIWFTANYTTGTKKLQAHFEEDQWITWMDVTTSPIQMPITMAGKVNYRIHDITNNTFSNFITITT